MNEILLVITEGKRPEKEIVDFLMQRLEEAASKPRIVWGYWNTDLSGILLLTFSSLFPFI